MRTLVQSFVVMLPLLGLLDEQLIRLALQRADIAIAKTQYYTGIDSRLFERRLRGDGYMRHNDLLKFPLGYWQWVSLYQVETYGLPPEVEKALLIDEAVHVSRRMSRVVPHAEKADRFA